MDQIWAWEKQGVWRSLILYCWDFFPVNQLLLHWLDMIELWVNFLGTPNYFCKTWTWELSSSSRYMRVSVLHLQNLHETCRWIWGDPRLRKYLTTIAEIIFHLLGSCWWIYIFGLLKALFHHTTRYGAFNAVMIPRNSQALLSTLTTRFSTRILTWRFSMDRTLCLWRGFRKNYRWQLKVRPTKGLVTASMKTTDAGVKDGCSRWKQMPRISLSGILGDQNNYDFLAATL